MPLNLTWCLILAGSAATAAPETPPKLVARIDAVEAALNGGTALSADEAKDAIDELRKAFGSHPPALKPQAERLLKAATAATVPPPTPAKPLASTATTARLAVAVRSMLVPYQLPAQATADPAAAAFPGPVPPSAKRVTKTVSVPTGVPGYVCNGVGVSDKAAIWHSTGLYAAPGETVTVTVPAEVAGKDLGVRIGCHTDKLWKLDQWKRAPDISLTVPLATATTTAFNPFGGLVYITVPPAASLGTVSVKIAGAVEAMTFIEGQTTAAEWRTARDSQAPWAEFVGKKLIMAVPAAVAKKVEDPHEITAFWDTVMDGCADLTVVSHDRGRAERFVHDVQISAGYMHSGYPIMCPLNEATRALDVPRIRREGAWGYFHELGHNHQQPVWTFDGTTEVTCNLYSLYLYEQLCPTAPLHEAMRPASVAKHAAEYKAGGAKFETWKKEPFTALIVYKQMRDEFGWEVFKKAFTAYKALPAGQRPKGDDAERDTWLVQFSKAAGKNVAPAFDLWGIPVSPAAKQAVADLPAWTPPAVPGS